MVWKVNDLFKSSDKIFNVTKGDQSMPKLPTSSFLDKED